MQSGFAPQAMSGRWLIGLVVKRAAGFLFLFACYKLLILRWQVITVDNAVLEIAALLSKRDWICLADIV
ncbi:MAG TPA: hypothetical protein V6C72_18365 [Chroococcales cyanobacterium]